MEGKNEGQSSGRRTLKLIKLERDLEESLCKYPELIAPDLAGIRQGMHFVNPDGPYLRRQDKLPNGRLADMVFVETARVTVVELKKVPLKVSVDNTEDSVDQILDYMNQCREKYPNRLEYRGFIVGPYAPDEEALNSKIICAGQNISFLIFGRHIPSSIIICERCGLARGFNSSKCACVKTCST